MKKSRKIRSSEKRLEEVSRSIILFVSILRCESPVRPSVEGKPEIIHQSGRWQLRAERMREGARSLPHAPGTYPLGIESGYGVIDSFLNG